MANAISQPNEYFLYILVLNFVPSRNRIKLILAPKDFANKFRFPYCRTVGKRFYRLLFLCIWHLLQIVKYRRV